MPRPHCDIRDTNKCVNAKEVAVYEKDSFLEETAD